MGVVADWAAKALVCMKTPTILGAGREILTVHKAGLGRRKPGRGVSSGTWPPWLTSVSNKITTPALLSGPAMRIDQIPVGKNVPEDVNVIIEVPIGGEPIKYELDKASGALVVDRFLYTSMRYPGNYGFVPHPLSGDGDPVDVLIANTRAIAPGAVMSVRPVGVLLMEDNAGMDEKIVAVPSSHISQRFDGVTNYSDLPEITLKQIEHFFAHYKDLEPGKWVKIIGWGDAAEAKKLITDGVARAKAEKNQG